MNTPKIKGCEWCNVRPAGVCPDNFTYKKRCDTCDKAWNELMAKIDTKIKEGK